MKSNSMVLVNLLRDRDLLKIVFSGNVEFKYNVWKIN